MKMKMKAKYFAKIKTSVDDENLNNQEYEVKEVLFNTNYKHNYSQIPGTPEYC